MYVKCGYLESARSVFERMPEKDVVSWTSMVGCFAKHGFLGLAHECFREMPNKNAVSWNTLISRHIQNGHDLLGQGGLSAKAIQLIGLMPMRPDRYGEHC
ncbi:hypothetical protein MLD38_004986 [Melastoma candidum]|uniref:Uncharacterized protein n=1 Tax=Melastoma candidum TaxID=119954 RepID=A0ACB9S765_9MYRT|nr:hypothetical protein MLD38_004986 [Melastoma candidum]